ADELARHVFTPRGCRDSLPRSVGTLAGSEPAADDHLLVRVELDAVAAVRLEVAVEAALGAAEREVRHRCRNADVHPEHARLDAITILARPLAARREDARRVAELVLANDLDRFVEVLRLHHAEHRPKISSLPITISGVTSSKIDGPM